MNITRLIVLYRQESFLRYDGRFFLAKQRDSATSANETTRKRLTRKSLQLQ